jgi:acyl-CoA synthetase (AMP-forming)/AMP-acid ligase II
MYRNIAQVLSETASRHSSRTALIEAASGRSCTFEELDRYAEQYGAYLLEQGVAPGQRVILMVRPSIDFIALSFGLFRIGAPVILIDPGMGYKNLLTCIEGVRPDYLIGIPAVVALSMLFNSRFSTVRKRFCCGAFPGLGRFDIRRQLSSPWRNHDIFLPDQDALAAIIFTTGSTGPPKGVRFEHSIFSAQLQKIRSYYDIGAVDIDQPGFPLFALFSTALAATAVIPDMDPTKPAQVDGEKFVASILQHQVTYSFGSPAIWNVVSRYCLDHKIRCHSLKKVLMAGAPVGGELIERVYKMIGADGEVHIPYGATESLPIVSIEGREVVEQTWPETRDGKGTCVGRPLPGVETAVIEAIDGIIEEIDDARRCEIGEIGEIIVKGDVVTRAYDNNDEQNRASKIQDKDAFWHRIGDVGYIDDHSRLWFCGRKGHRVHAEGGIMYTICCEAIANNHPDVFRSALVGIDGNGTFEVPVIVIEPMQPAARKDEEIVSEVKQLCADHPLTKNIEHVLVNRSFPVDIRHNAKIFREKLSVWANSKITGIQ